MVHHVVSIVPAQRKEPREEETGEIPLGAASLQGYTTGSQQCGVCFHNADQSVIKCVGHGHEYLRADCGTELMFPSSSHCLLLAVDSEL